MLCDTVLFERCISFVSRICTPLSLTLTLTLVPNILLALLTALSLRLFLSLFPACHYLSPSSALGSASYCAYKVFHTWTENTSQGNVKTSSCTWRDPSAGSSQPSAWSCAPCRVHPDWSHLSSAPAMPVPLALETASLRSLAAWRGQLQGVVGSFCGHVLVCSACFL